MKRARAMTLSAVAATVGASAALIASLPSGNPAQAATAHATAAEGKAVFVRSCQGCHPSGGATAGVGPKLTARGLTKARIENQVRNGGGAMPAGLVTGTDLDAVVTYVVSIQRTAPKVRVLRPSSKMKKALNNAVRRKLKAKKISRKGLRGPLKGTRRRTTQVKWARVGTTEWAIGTFTRAKVGKRNQPEIFRRTAGKRWVNIVTSRGCFTRVPANVRKAWKIPKGRC
ncbi:MAG: cytochrome c [Thermoleophilia bacterium]|nr:cytochrome c [Thermoleophilia bacterium]MDH3725155.1 cytochrome c [Thermoleophilia bacterium]